VVVIIGMGVRADVGLHKKEFAVLYASVAVLEIGTPLPQRFDFCAKQNHASLNDLDNFVVIPGLFIPAHYLDVR
jgi:hypothetical protein